jgi:hypothetical protein
MLIGVAWGLHWACITVTRSSGLRPVSGGGIGHLGSISGGLLAPRYVCIYLPAESLLVVPHCDPRLGALGVGGVLAMFVVIWLGAIF